METKLKQCGQIIDGEQCPTLARYRYTWPGRDEAFICSEHVDQLRNVANALDLHLQVVDVFAELIADSER